MISGGCLGFGGSRPAGGIEVLGVGIKLVCTENPEIPCLGRAVEDLGVGKGGGLGQAPKNRGQRQGAAVPSGRRARARNPRRGQRLCGARMLALTQRREGGCGGLGRGLGLRGVLMESPRVC